MAREDSDLHGIFAWHGIVPVAARSRQLDCVTIALVGGRAQGALVQPRSPEQAQGQDSGGPCWLMQLQARGALNLPLKGKSPDCISSNEESVHARRLLRKPIKSSIKPWPVC